MNDVQTLRRVKNIICCTIINDIFKRRPRSKRPSSLAAGVVYSSAVTFGAKGIHLNEKVSISFER